MAELRVVENHPQWDSFVSSQLYAPPFSCTDFLQLVTDTYGGSVTTVAVLKGERVLLGVALRTVGRQVRAAAPMTYMPIIYRDAHPKTLLEAQLTLASYLREKFSVIHYISATPFFQDIRGFQRAGFGAQVLYTALTHLPSFNVMTVEQKQRNIIYKGQKEGLALNETDRMEQLWPIYESTFRRKALETAYSKLFFTRLPELGPKVRTYVVERDGQVLSFATILIHNKVAYYYVSGNSVEALKSGASPFLMYSILNQLKEEGLEYFDWCGINLPSLANFKLSFGGRTAPYLAVYFEPKWLRMLKAR
ncbi:GNAT family N-acetyltransferase [Coprothermobacteraceae bacterium]|nr:GNAT family N-acetyltransferase [Coprothermobacteraceae bacterium]